MTFNLFFIKKKIKGNRKYHYMIKKPVIHRYSDALIELIVNKIERDQEYLKKREKCIKTGGNNMPAIF